MESNRFQYVDLMMTFCISSWALVNRSDILFLSFGFYCITWAGNESLKITVMDIKTLAMEDRYCYYYVFWTRIGLFRGGRIRIYQIQEDRDIVIFRLFKHFSLMFVLS